MSFLIQSPENGLLKILKQNKRSTYSRITISTVPRIASSFRGLLYGWVQTSKVVTLLALVAFNRISDYALSLADVTNGTFSWHDYFCPQRNPGYR